MGFCVCVFVCVFLADFSAVNSFCWGLKGAERCEGLLVQLATEESLSVSNFAEAKGFIYS